MVNLTDLGERLRYVDDPIIQLQLTLSQLREFTIPVIRTVMLKSACWYNVFSKAASFLRSMYLERRTCAGIMHSGSETDGVAIKPRPSCI